MAVGDSLLRTRQVAEALGVSVSTIKRWVDSDVLRATRTVGGHRLIPLAEAIHFARRQGLPTEGLELMASVDGGLVGTIDERAREALAMLLREGRSREARAVIRSIHASCRDAVALADRLIQPVMERIGHGWMEGGLDVYQEHQATQTVAASLGDLIAASERTAPGANAPLALGAAPAGDPYVLPVLLGELVLREIGWEVRNLGNNLPLQSLANAVHRYQPALVFLTVSHVADDDRFLREYQAFQEVAASTKVAVMVGGRALTPDRRSKLALAGFGDRMANLSEFAESLRLADDGTTNQPRSAHP